MNVLIVDGLGLQRYNEVQSTTRFNSETCRKWMETVAHGVYCGLNMHVKTVIGNYLRVWRVKSHAEALDSHPCPHQAPLSEIIGPLWCGDRVQLRRCCKPCGVLDAVG